MPTIPHVEKHFTATETVRDVVIGLADGLTVSFAPAAGLSAAVASTKLIRPAGFAEIFAGSIAMAEAISPPKQTPSISIRKPSAKLTRSTITKSTRLGNWKRSSRHTTWRVRTSRHSYPPSQPIRRVDGVMRSELGLEKPDPIQAPTSAATIATSYFVGGLIPLLPTPWPASSTKPSGSRLSSRAPRCSPSAQAKTTSPHPRDRVKSAAQTLPVGGLAAGAAFGLACYFS